MKKRNPHDISDMASPEEKIPAVSSYRRAPQLRSERTSSCTEAKPEDADKGREKSTYEFGQPVFRRDLRKQVEVSSHTWSNYELTLCTYSVLTFSLPLSAEQESIDQSY